MSTGLAEPQVELSDEAKKLLEDITLAAFHNLLIETVAIVTEQMRENASLITAIQTSAACEIHKRMNENTEETSDPA